MTRRDDSRASRSAEDIYGDFLRRRREGEDIELEDYCREHPRLAHALRALHSLDADVPSEKSTLIVPEFEDAVARLPAREDDPETGPVKPGDRVGAYQVREVLGEGGFAFVYRADQLEPVKRPVALKTIKLGLDTKQVIARFEAERQALALMSHSHIAKVYDAGVTDDGRPYFVMEYVDGVPITEYCDKNNLTVEGRLELFLLVCDAVQHAHQKAIIHRDLKPSNVLVTTEGDRAVPKIIDFGIAKATIPLPTEETLFTQTGQIIGTPEYMSPEQVDSGAIDTRTDIYALGVLLYELLCGVRPFDARRLRMAGFAELWRIIREDTPPRPSTRLSTLGGATREIAQRRRTNPQFLARRLRGDLDWIAMKSLAKKPDERYASASEFAADLRRHLNAEPVLAGPPSLGYRLRKFAYRRRRALVAMMLALVAAGIVGLVVRRVVENRQYEERVAESRRFFGEGERLVREAHDAQVALANFEEDYREARQAVPDWVPIWERGEELDAWNRVRGLRRDLEDRYTEAFLEYTNALNLAPAESEPWSRVVRALRRLSEDVEAAGRVSLGTVLLKQQIESTLAGGAPLPDVLSQAPSTMRFTTRPPGTEVFLFRYEEVEQRLLPMPYDPRPAGDGTLGRTIGKPFLRVERIWDAERTTLLSARTDSDAAPDTFRRGDRLLSVAGRPISTRGDLARALSDLDPDVAVPLKLRRGGEVLAFRWVPFRAAWYGKSTQADHLVPGRVVCIRDQFGLTFEGYPLDFREECRVGVTAPDNRVSVELPPGSYLFVFRKEGYAEARYPVRVREQHEVVREVKLLEVDEVPRGFVYIPAGPFTHGGSDHEFLQNLEYGETDLVGFFMSRYEVTFAEYLEFLNARVDRGSGRATPESDEARTQLERKAGRRLNESEMSVDLLPYDENSGETPSYFVRRTDGRWTARPAKYTDAPLFGISYLAAVEYAHWRTKTEGKGWRYRLASDKEWEKAARGADGRLFVWGDYMVWSYSWNRNGVHTSRKFPAGSPGMSPQDESVYGVRDLAGSVHEPTTGRPKEGRRYIVLRGGAWESEDMYEFRTDVRTGFVPESLSRRIGIRLVADLERDPRFIAPRENDTREE